MNGRTIERAIRTLLRERAAGKSICPSEVARALAPDDWRPLMPRLREVAARLASSGEQKAERDRTYRAWRRAQAAARSRR